MDIAQITSFVLLFVLITCSALISGAEVALFSLTPSDFETNNEKTNAKKFAILEALLSKPKKLLATILVANNFINIAIVLLFSSLTNALFSGLQTNLFGIDLRFIIEVGVVTFFILLFGEILPKIYANRNRLTFAVLMAHPLNILDTLLSPITIPMRASTVYLHSRFGNKKSNISVDHLSQALELSNKDTTQEEQRILQGIVTFGNTDTKQVMKNRMDIFALSEDESFKEILPEILEHGYSRIPVYKDSIDNITGILYVKDLVPYTDRKILDWKTLKRDAYFVPENKKLDDLLNEFKEMKMRSEERRVGKECRYRRTPYK